MYRTCPEHPHILECIQEIKRKQLLQWVIILGLAVSLGFDIAPYVAAVIP